ncbi:MAG: LysM peptidoglycan-binding domain-containing M23 family metallopeptidase [Myxococcota bacterium]|nr:LysM peptidoglycan-binding domain-containing M23 family metallopeptidase [Myxococcota bacterium]
MLGCGGQQRVQHTHRVTRPPPAELIGVWYTIEAGDTLAGLAARFEVPLEDLIEANGLTQPNDLKAGQPLFIYGVDKLVQRLAKKTEKIKRKRTGKPARGVRFKWPVRTGVLTSAYGPRGRRMHKGIDLAARIGTPIYAAADGTVVYSDNRQRGYGNLVILRHRNRVLTVYAHNDRNLVDEGDKVRQGAKIAELGNTGRSTGPHLHFEIRIRGKAVDPLKYLPTR